MDQFINFATAILSGDATTALIVVLLLVIGGLVYALLKLWKHSNSLTVHLRDVTQDYIGRIDSIMNNQQQSQSAMLDAMRDIRIVLAELKGKLT